MSLRRPSPGLVVLAGATTLAMGAAAACSLDFDRYAAVADAMSGRPDVGMDTSPPGNEASSPDVSPGEDAGPVEDAGGGDGSTGPGPDGSAADCGAVVQGCTSAAGSCGTACGVTSQQCQSQCHSDPCKTHCQQAEQTCRQGCEGTCTSCIGHAGCSGSAGCADAAFTD
jgi:hypothetical protein